MEILPNELIIEIFKYLPLHDLVNLSKISNRFKNIIDNTPSLKFFTLKFKKGKTECEKSQRFARLTVEVFKSGIHSRMLAICGVNINSITFTGSAMSFSEIATILKFCPNARQVRFENVSTWPEVMRQFPQLNNLYIQLSESSTCLLNLFIQSRVNTLNIISNSDKPDSGIRSFLHTQKYLTSMYCKGSQVLDLFYTEGNNFSENYQILPFRLKILVLKDILWWPQYIDILTPSIKTLTFLELSDIVPFHVSFEVEELINMCERLEELSLKFIHFNDIQSSTIKRITIRSFAGNGNWLKRMKNLKTLKVYENSQLEYDFSLNNELCDVEIHESEIESSIQMPHVKKLILNDIRKLPQTFINGNLSEIEEIRVSNCGALTEQIVREIGINARNLKLLSVSNGNCKEETMIEMRRNLINLKNFCVKNLNYERIDDNDYERVD